MSEHVVKGLATEELQQELRDLLDLAVVGDHVRWVVTGDAAGGLADWLAGAVPQWRALADQVSRHLVTLGVAPDGRVRSLAKDIPVHWVPEGWLSADGATPHRLPCAHRGWVGPISTLAGDGPRDSTVARRRVLAFGRAGACGRVAAPRGCGYRCVAARTGC